MLMGLWQYDRVVLGDYSPKTPTDPYVRTLAHTAPQNFASLRAFCFHHLACECDDFKFCHDGALFCNKRNKMRKIGKVCW